MNRNIEKDSVLSINAIDYIIEYKDISEINID